MGMRLLQLQLCTVHPQPHLSTHMLHQIAVVVEAAALHLHLCTMLMMMMVMMLMMMMMLRRITS